MKNHNPNGVERLPAWNITQLAQNLREDLTLCTTESERVNCRGCYTADMRKLRNEAIEHGRKLTPGEIAVLREFGIATPDEMELPLS